MITRTAIAFAALSLLAPCRHGPGRAADAAYPTGRGIASVGKRRGRADRQAGTGPKTAYQGDHENYYVEYATRSDAGNEAEVHAHWSHYINVLSGEAVLTYGGTVVNNARDSTRPGTGQRHHGGKTMTLHVEILQIPASMPHMLNPTKGTKFHYVVSGLRRVSTR